LLLLLLLLLSSSCYSTALFSNGSIIQVEAFLAAINEFAFANDIQWLGRSCPLVIDCKQQEVQRCKERATMSC
jgi:hypothetical protein